MKIKNQEEKDNLIHALRSAVLVTDEINGILSEAEYGEDDENIRDYYMNFPTYDTIKDMIKLVKEAVVGEEEE